MKSKTSCFNRTIFRKNFTQYWPLWVLYLGFLLLIEPVQIWQTATNDWFYLESDSMYDVIQGVVKDGITPFPIFFFAAIMVLAVFSYLYSAKNANMIHALPVDRLELFTTNYLSGLCFMLIPEIVAFLAAVLVSLANNITCIQYLFFGVICQIGMTFFAYSLAVFVAMFTGQIFAMPVYYFIVNYLYVGCLYLVSLVIELVAYGVSDTWNPGKSCILSPMYYLKNNLWIETLYTDDGNTIKGMEIHGTYLIAIYAVAAIVAVVAAYQLYKRRQVETAGDWISIGIVKPIFRWGVAMCGGILGSIMIANALYSSHKADVYVCMIVGIAIAGFIFFFAAEMLIEKNFRVFRKKRLLEWSGFTVVAIIFITMFKLDAFGVERKLPDANEVETAFVYMDYPVQVEDVSELIEIHAQIIEDKKAYQAISKKNEGYYYTTLRYYMKDGSTFERRYPLPITDEYVKDATSPTAKILAWESETENIEKNIFGVGHNTNKYMSGYIELYNKDQDLQTHACSSEELEQIVAALKKDIEEGNMTAYYINCINNESVERYMNCISIEYYNTTGYYDNWDYYYNYRRYKNADEEAQAIKAGMTSTTTSSYISFGAKCTNLVETIESFGIEDDTWGLQVVDSY